MPDLMHALAYIRTSSLTNVGEDKDTRERQIAAIQEGAARLGYGIVGEYYDAGVSGDVPVTERPQFVAMLDRIDGNGVRTVFVEGADRFARKMLTAELGLLALISRDCTLYTSSGEDLTNTDDEMRVAFRQIAMAFAQLEKARLTKKLKGARDRKSAQAGRRIEGRKGYTRGRPDLVALVKSLTGTLEQRSARLAELGHVTRSGRPFSASQVKRLIEARS